MELHKKLKYLREITGLNQEPVAKALGIKRETYSYYETGKTKPKLETLCKIARMYNITVDELLDFELDDNRTLKVRSKNPLIDNWSTNDKLNELSEKDQAFLIRIRLLSNEQQNELAEYIDKMMGLNNKE